MVDVTDDLIHAVFVQFDKDGSGTIDSEELKNMLSCVYIDLTDDEMKQDKYNLDGDPDSLNEEEFRLFIRDKLNSVDSKQQFLYSLLEFDEDKTEAIPAFKLKEILTQRGDQPLTEEEADAFIKEIDLNNDGLVSIRELVTRVYSQETNLLGD